MKHLLLNTDVCNNWVDCLNMNGMYCKHMSVSRSNYSILHASHLTFWPCVNGYSWSIIVIVTLLLVQKLHYYIWTFEYSNLPNELKVAWESLGNHLSVSYLSIRSTSHNSECFICNCWVINHVDTSWKILKKQPNSPRIYWWRYC